MLSSFSGVTFVLFRFRLYTYVEAATLRSIALRYSGAPTATRVSFFFPFFLFSFCFFGDVAFSEYFCAIAILFLYGGYVARFFFFPSGG